MNPKSSILTVLLSATLSTAAFAQGGAPAGAAPAGPMVLVAQFAPFLLVFAIMYFLMIRPQQQRQAELTKVQSGLSKGDRVLTQAGIYGTVVGVDGDKVVLRVDDNVKLEFQRSTIVGLATDKK
jgi:preprotein translocase subunit YajC